MNILARFRAMGPEGINPADELALRRGCIGDYQALARFHYRGGHPATICDVLAFTSEEATAACLVVSRPMLNAWWRELAWPGRFRTGDRREAAARINAELRVISRVIVDPRYRGIGLAHRLVSAYLAEALTPCTEAVAAMGRGCPFFERAGMAVHRRPRSGRDEALLRALGGRPHVLLSRVPRGRVEALRTWANASSATRGLDSELDLARAAAAALLAPPMAYTSSPPEGCGPAAGGDHVPVDTRGGGSARVASRAPRS